MSQLAAIVVSLVIAGVVGSGITVLVASVVRRSSSLSSRGITVPGASFVVSSRGWQSKLLAGTGVLFVAIGFVLVVLAVVVGGSAAGGGIPGVIIALGGGVFLWLARGVARKRLEVAPDSVWVFGRGRAPREIPVGEITDLVPLASNRYGGVLARADRKKLFGVSRLMVGYPQLIEYLGARRPDLVIPESSRPL